MKCMDCVFCGVEDFTKVNRVAGENGAAMEEEVDAQATVCRFYPPTGSSRIKPIWPVVDCNGDWCGRGKSAEGKAFVE